MGDSRDPRPALAVVALLLGLAACAGDGPVPPPAPGTTAVAPAAPSTSPPVTTAAPSPAADAATPAPAWLGTWVLPTTADGLGEPQRTPAELLPRRIETVDELPPPADGRFHSRVVPVPAEVAARSTWTSGCPVGLDDLRYLTLTFRGFDGRAHTGELVVNRSAAGDLVTVFRKLFEAGFPIERMRVTSLADLDAPPTGDGNTTAAFACRPVVGSTGTWSEHAYGRAVDVDPFQNPRVKGGSVIPELATAYADRDLDLPGMITRNSAVTKAFASVGWGWGGNFASSKDWMHFSADGR